MECDERQLQRLYRSMQRQQTHEAATTARAQFEASTQALVEKLAAEREARLAEIDARIREDRDFARRWLEEAEKGQEYT
jgi:hypothetical protein